MRVGMTLTFMGENYLATDQYEVAHGADLAAFQREMTLANLAEPLGFDSLWGVEHHFSSYSMMPDALQVLAYMAGRTTTLSFGTMVMVLPWHNPVRLAGAIATLDNLAGGRFTLGIGRGLGRSEFEGFGVTMAESRERFIEHAEMLLLGLNEGYIERKSESYNIARAAIRPIPTYTFKNRTYASAVSPESFDVMAQLGVGLLVIPQKPWETIIRDVTGYREVYARINGEEAPEPIVASYIFCDDDAERAREDGERYIGEYYRACVKHYELDKTNFRDAKGGYSYYEKTAKVLQEQSAEDSERHYAGLQCWGTPDQCIEKIEFIKESIGCSEILGIFSYSDLSTAEASRNVHLFADKVIPTLHAMPGPRDDTGTVLTPRGDVDIAE